MWLQQNGDWIERNQLIILNECDDNTDHREMDSYGLLSSTRYKPSGVWGVHRADDGDKRDKAEKLKRGKRVNRGPIRWEIKEIPTNTNQSDDPDRS